MLLWVFSQSMFQGCPTPAWQFRVVVRPRISSATDFSCGTRRYIGFYGFDNRVLLACRVESSCHKFIVIPVETGIQALDSGHSLAGKTILMCGEFLIEHISDAYSEKLEGRFFKVSGGTECAAIFNEFSRCNWRQAGIALYAFLALKTPG